MDVRIIGGWRIPADDEAKTMQVPELRATVPPGPRRNLRHQGYCSAATCRQARRLAKPQKENYFRGPEHVARVRAWRAATPGYARRGRAALQDDSLTQIVDQTGKIGFLTTTALQEDSYAQALILTGLIASLPGTALQEDIARSVRRFQKLALDILNGELRHGDQPPAPVSG